MTLYMRSITKLPTTQTRGRLPFMPSREYSESADYQPAYSLSLNRADMIIVAMLTMSAPRNADQNPRT